MSNILTSKKLFIQNWKLRRKKPMKVIIQNYYPIFYIVKVKGILQTRKKFFFLKKRTIMRLKVETKMENKKINPT